MQLAFESELLRSICENEATAETELGPDIAPALRGRLADLSAAASIRALPAGNPHFADVEDTECLVIDLTRNCQLICKANHARNPLVASGNLDWDQVSRIKVVHIGRGYDYQCRIST